MEKLLEKYIRELKIRNYSRRTIKQYSFYLNKFFNYCLLHAKWSRDDKIYRFLETYNDKEAAKSGAIAALKFFYKHIHKVKCQILNFKKKKRKRIPYVLSKKDILHILSFISNPQHRVMIAMLFGSGLRISELVHIKVKDLNFDTERLYIHKSKNKKDRYTLLSSSTFESLKEIVEKRRTSDYLFLTISGKGYSTRTVQKIFENALEKSGIKKAATCHTLRHSFATSLLESGIDVRIIQDLLGHKNLQTTMVYTHITDSLCKGVKSPL